MSSTKRQNHAPSAPQRHPEPCEEKAPLTLQDLERAVTLDAQLAALDLLSRDQRESQQQRAIRMKAVPPAQRGGLVEALMIPPSGVTGRAAQGYRVIMSHIIDVY